MIEPKIGEIFSLHGIKVKTCPIKDNEDCINCAFAYLECDNVVCNPGSREDATQVIFKKVKEMEVKIQIPDNCELIKDGNTYIVKEKQNLPRSWEEFCERYSVKDTEVYIASDSSIVPSRLIDAKARHAIDKNWCVSKEEAEAFLALIQLRQLRKAWVGDWERPEGKPIAGVFYSFSEDKITTSYDRFWTNVVLSFPTKEMAEDFLSCFRDLCETAKILL